MVKQIKPLPPFKPIEEFPASGIGYIPTVYNKGMDLYQAVCYLEWYVVQTYNSMNEIIDDWNTLQEWIDTQLDGYARQQLQEWLDDGTLASIINEEIFGELNARVTQNTNDILPLKTRFKVVLPSNDVTGVQDPLTIQEALDSYKVVYLAKGDYYLNKSLQFGIGYELHGVSQIDTRIHVLNDTSFIEGKAGGHDHISVTDMIIQCGTGNKTNKCLNLYGNMTTPYNGARYSYFKNLWIDNFDIAIAFSGVWSTVVERVRCSANNISVSCLGSCNNLTFVDCEFMQGKTGVSLSPSSGSELYGVRIVRCNFEGNSIVCVNAQGVIGLSIEDIYSEQTPRLISINSCPNFVFKGGQATGVSLFGSIEATAYSSPKFANPRFTIKDLNIETNLNVDTTLSYIGSGITGNTIQNIRIKNLGGGTVKLLANLSPVNYRIEETSYFDVDPTTIKGKVNSSRGVNDTVYITQVYFFVSRAFTPTSNGQLLCRVKNASGGYDTIGTLNLNSGQTYAVGQYLSFVLTSNAPTKGQQEFLFIYNTSIGVSAYVNATVVTQTGNLIEQV